MLPSIYWALRDKTVWPWDQAWYGEVSADLWFLLAHHPGQWPASMLNAFGTKAPGVAWIGQFFVPLGQAAGSIEFGLMLSILAAHFGTLLLMYRIGLRLSSGSRAIALFGTLLAASAPLSAAMAHQYLVESLQVLTVTYIFWIAIAAPEMSRLRLLAHLLVAVSVALLAKSTSPLYCALAGVLAVYSFFRANSWVKDRRDRIGSLALLFIGSILAAGALGWYAHNLQHVIDFARIATSGAIALNYGVAGTFYSKLVYWLGAARASFFIPFAVTALSLIALAGVYLAWKHGYRARPKHATLIAAFALVHIVFVLALFSTQVNQENRYLLPLLP
ncbi:MAG TPA: glycosyltransferase family 39 protein, partial [Bryobacteraceae bacterium]